MLKENHQTTPSWFPGSSRFNSIVTHLLIFNLLWVREKETNARERVERESSMELSWLPWLRGRKVNGGKIRKRKGRKRKKKDYLRIMVHLGGEWVCCCKLTALNLIVNLWGPPEEVLPWELRLSSTTRLWCRWHILCIFKSAVEFCIDRLQLYFVSVAWLLLPQTRCCTYITQSIVLKLTKFRNSLFKSWVNWKKNHTLPRAYRP